MGRRGVTQETPTGSPEINTPVEALKKFQKPFRGLPKLRYLSAICVLRWRLSLGCLVRASPPPRFVHEAWPLTGGSALRRHVSKVKARVAGYRARGLFCYCLTPYRLDAVSHACLPIATGRSIIICVH